MSLVCCDTSFLFSLYVGDIYTPRATAKLRVLATAVAISPLNEYEFGNAVRFSVYRSLRNSKDADVILTAFAADVASGALFTPVYNLASVLVEARRLSNAYTQKHGFRSFDILHVATAVVTGATEFLTFDENQRQLAIFGGLKTKL